MVAALFDADPDTSRVGVVAARSDELMTRVLSADDLGRTITTPRGEPHLRWDPRLPLTLAARRILEQSAPEWPAFEFGGADQRLIVGGADQRGTVDHAYGDPLDLTTVAAEIARRVIEREAGRSYRGDKRRAYQAMVGQERAFADLVARVCVPGTDLDLDEETERILRAAA
jgi:hypothetical protein